MNTINLGFIDKRKIFLPVLALSILLGSCARKMSFSNSSVVPGARGSVKLKTDKNNNNSIEVDVLHLAPPDMLTPPRKVYVVWIVTENNGTQNVGQLKSSSSMLSKTLKGSLETKSTFKPVSVFIKAEDDGTIQYPGNTIVLNTN